MKTKKFTKPFLPFHIEPRSNILSPKNGQKSHDTIPLNSYADFLVFTKIFHILQSSKFKTPMFATQ